MNANQTCQTVLAANVPPVKIPVNARNIYKRRKIRPIENCNAQSSKEKKLQVATLLIDAISRK